MKPREIARLFEERVLPPLTSELQQQQNELGKKPIVHFSKKISTLLQAAFEGFLELTEIPRLEDLDRELKAICVKSTISHLNGELPLDYPYVVAVLYIEDEDDLRFTCSGRNLIPGAHDLLRKNIAPVILLNSLDDITRIETGEITLKVFFMNNDKDDLPGL